MENKNTNTNLKGNQATHFTDRNTGMILMEKETKPKTLRLWKGYKKVMCLFHDEPMRRNGNLKNARC